MARPHRPQTAGGSPVDFNSYVAYKRDTRHFLFWMINTSNSIIKKYPKCQDCSSAGPRLTINTSGQTTVAGLIAMAHLIAGYMKPIPSTITQLLQSIIYARSVHHKEFQRHAASCPNANVKRSNTSHKHYIDALATILGVFGGISEVQEIKGERFVNISQAEVEETLFSNKFSVLHVNLAGDENKGDSGSEHELQAQGKSSRTTTKKRRNLQSKKSKKGPKAHAHHPANADLGGIPMENYRILEGDDELQEYAMAALALKNEWHLLRGYLFETWDQVGYRGMQGVVATGLCKIAIAAVQRSELAIFVDFLGKDSFEMVIKTLTRGGNFEDMQARAVALEHAGGHKGPEIDIREQFLLYAYHDLIDFIKDFRQSRTGKPTKAMQAELSWDPAFQPKLANNKQRIQWRRAYAICWLYDLVNVFSAPFFEHGYADRRQQTKKLEEVDWTAKGPWQGFQKLFGMHDFAAWVTTLAMQRPGADGDLTRRILPHHVFQLQSVLDSMTATYGWTFDYTGAHLVKPGPAAFWAERDISDFFGVTHNTSCAAFKHGVDLMLACLEYDAEIHGDPNRNFLKAAVLKNLDADLADNLGASYPARREPLGPPSRFDPSESNGLWGFNPLMCGEGMVEALQLVYITGLWLLDSTPEPTMAIHLHNMLVEQGRMEPVEIYQFCQTQFRNCFFADGAPPKSNFKQAFGKQCVIQSARSKHNNPSVRIRTEKEARAGKRVFGQIHFCKRKSMLMLLAESNWNPSRIPDHELDWKSVLTSARIGRTKQVIDPVTGEGGLEQTDLVKNLKAQGADEKFLYDFVSQARRLREIDGEDDAPAPGLHAKRKPRGRRDMQEMSVVELMECSKFDLLADVCGSEALSGTNFIWIAATFSEMFVKLEERLKAEESPVYKRVYGTRSQWRHLRRLGLTRIALEEQDEAYLKIMAEVIQESAKKPADHTYWEKLETPMDTLHGSEGAIKRAQETLRKMLTGVPGLKEMFCDLSASLGLDVSRLTGGPA